MTKKRKIAYVSDNEKLMKEWDFEKNENLNPEKISYGSAQKAWWKCTVCGNSWCASLNSRSRGCGCPICAQKSRAETKSKNAAKKNNFAISFPEIAKEWHPTKNENLLAEDVSSSSNKKVWWRCSKCGNEWQTTVNHRTQESNGCPVCSRERGAELKVKTHATRNNFLEKCPEIAKEWHPTKNNKLLANGVSACSNKKVWWQCSFCSHEWQDTVSHRYNGRGCPKCSKSGTSVSEQIVYYYVKKAFPDAVNRIQMEYEFDIYIPSKNTAIEYDGYFFHNSSKNFNRDCLKDEFCHKNNIRLIRFRTKRLQSTKFAYKIECEDWQIEKGIVELFKLLDCPCPKIDLNKDEIEILNCFRSTIKERSLIEQYPHIAEEWHSVKNGSVSANAVLPMSNTKYWWQCKICGYEWRDAPYHRCGRNSGCPFCAGKIVISGVNDLATNRPQLIEEWCFEKNKDTSPSTMAVRSNKKVWWKCLEYEHEWQAAVSERTRQDKPTGCPYCNNRKVLIGFNDLASTHPQLASEWSKDNELSPQQVTHGSKRKVWWECRVCANKWQAVVYSRSKGNGCPNCANDKRKQHKRKS